MEIPVLFQLAEDLLAFIGDIPYFGKLPIECKRISDIG